MGKQEILQGTAIEIHPQATIIPLHLAFYFLVQKNREETEQVLRERGLTLHDYYYEIPPEERKEIGWKEANCDSQGFFTFLPGKLILGHTDENIDIPRNRMLFIEDYFRLEDTGEVLPLTTNISARILKQGSRGPQTYEIRNESEKPLTLYIPSLTCIAYIKQTTPSDRKPNGYFSSQTRGDISLGRLTKW